ncbi:MAG: LamG-like jellyroll fold domain-containing protein, partial [Planctomyces sp.]
MYLPGTTGYRTVWGTYGSGNTTGVQITIWQATGGVPANAPTVYYGSTAINATTGAAASQWNHVAATRSGNAVTIFLNGVQVGSGTNAGSVGTSRNWTLGQDTDSNAQPMIGSIDDHTVYARPMTPDEIRRLYLLG